MHYYIAYGLKLALFLLAVVSSSVCHAQDLGKCLSLERGSAVQVQCLQAFGEKGTPSDQYSLAKVYYEGDEAPLDYGEVEKWLLKSAERGSVDAQVTLGHVYLESIVSSASHAKAEQWFQSAAEQGCLLAQLRLALLLEKRYDYIGTLKWIIIADTRSESPDLEDTINYISGGVTQKERDAARKQAKAWLASHPKNKNFNKEGFYELEKE
ncbi:hypothetical protein [Pseudodesulfovibrio indicus]|uniref:tetratricopeptide repeat protein n=1 Tax=Pseudodesulfovibrio indicus TaxID=1716143 RepID=UPI00292D5B3C|nr:hypothetical protein [Pseudodesulfovibrio indicus]